MRCEGCPVGDDKLAELGLSPEDIFCGTGEPEETNYDVNGQRSGELGYVCTSPEVWDAANSSQQTQDSVVNSEVTRI